MSGGHDAASGEQPESTQSHEAMVSGSWPMESQQKGAMKELRVLVLILVSNPFPDAELE